MKRIATIIILALMMCGCTHSDDMRPFAPDTDSAVNLSINLRATVAESIDAQTGRAIHGVAGDTGTSFTWEAKKDAVGVVPCIYAMTPWSDRPEWEWSSIDTQLGTHQFVNQTTGAVADFTFEGQLWDPEYYTVNGLKLYACYPYDYCKYAGLNYEAADPYPEVVASLGALLQVGNNNTAHLDGTDFMVAEAVDVSPEEIASGEIEATMKFKHLFAKVQFTVKNNTTEPFQIHSLVYRSNLTSDLMQGVLRFNLMTGELSVPEYPQWGEPSPSNAAVLEVQDVSVAVGEEATLWAWIVPLDFTAENEAGRTADLILNTSQGAFMVEGVHFSESFKGGKVYRHRLTADASKLREDWAFISDPALVQFFVNGEYDWDADCYKSIVPLYEAPDEATVIDPNDEELILENLKGLFVRPSQCAAVEFLMLLPVSQGNTICLDGLQYFTGLKCLDLSQMASDMNPVLASRCIKLDHLQELEELYFGQTFYRSLDLSRNTKLKRLELGVMPMLTDLKGLDRLTELEEFTFGALGGIDIDLTKAKKLRRVVQNYDGETACSDRLDLGGLQLDHLSVSVANGYTDVNMEGMATDSLSWWTGAALNAVPSGVKYLDASVGDDAIHGCILDRLGEFTELKELLISSSTRAPQFTASHSSIERVELLVQSNNPTGMEYLTGVKYFDLYSYADITTPLDLSALQACEEIELSQLHQSTVILPQGNSSNLKRLSYEWVDYAVNNLPELALGNQPKLTYADLCLRGPSGESRVVSIGDAPLLDTLLLELGRGRVYTKEEKFKGTILFEGENYPALSCLSLIEGRYVTSLPLDRFPQLAHLGMMYSGVKTINLSKAASLTSFSSDVVYYLDGTKKSREEGSIVISQTQYDKALAETYSFDPQVNDATYGSIYKVVADPTE